MTVSNKFLNWRSIFLFVLALALLAIPAAQGFWVSQASRSASHNLAALKASLDSAYSVRRAEAVQTIRAERRVEATSLLIDRLDDPNQQVGLYVAQALGELAGPETLPALRASLRSPDANVRWRAALALGDHRDADAISLLSRALRDPEVLVQSSVARALAQIGTPQAAESLVNALGSAPDSVRHNAMSALQQMDEVAVPALSKALDSGNPAVRKDAATVLGYIASPQALPALQLATVDSDAAVRTEVTWAIDQIRKER
jgi:HEAT repeat protein